MSVQKQEVIIYTDGGCEPNPGTGGWAAVLLHGKHMKELSGSALATTNNRMELTAVIRALEALKRPCAVVVHTDSEYVKKGISQWMPNWKRRNWRGKAGPVKNVDLWQELDALNQKHQVRWEWVRGHAGDVLNERCDELAGDAIRALKAEQAR